MWGQCEVAPVFVGGQAENSVVRRVQPVTMMHVYNLRFRFRFLRLLVWESQNRFWLQSRIWLSWIKIDLVLHRACWKKHCALVTSKMSPRCKRRQSSPYYHLDIEFMFEMTLIHWAGIRTNEISNCNQCQPRRDMILFNFLTCIFSWTCAHDCEHIQQSNDTSDEQKLRSEWVIMRTVSIVLGCNTVRENVLLYAIDHSCYSLAVFLFERLKRM